MYRYITVENKQVTSLSEGVLQKVTNDVVKEVSEEESVLIKQEGVRAFLWDNGPKLKPLITLALDKPQITADENGSDMAILTVTTDEPTIASIDLFFNGTPFNQTLTNGTAQIPLTATDPQTIEITADMELYRFTPIVLEAV